MKSFNERFIMYEKLPKIYTVREDDKLSYDDILQIAKDSFDQPANYFSILCENLEQKLADLKKQHGVDIAHQDFIEDIIEDLPKDKQDKLRAYNHYTYTESAVCMLSQVLHQIGVQKEVYSSFKTIEAETKKLEEKDS